MARVVEDPYTTECEPRADRVEFVSAEPHGAVNRVVLLEVKVVRQEASSTSRRLHRSLTDSAPLFRGDHKKMALTDAACQPTHTPVRVPS